MNTIRTVIIDDEQHAVERLKRLLCSFSQIQVLESFTNSAKGLLFINQTKPDLVFLDVELDKNLSAFDLIKEIHKMNHYPKIILVTAHPQYSIKAIKNEVFDFIVKPVDIDELKETLDRLLDAISAGNKKLIQGFDNLSEREAQILKLVLDGKSSQEIAESLFISINTVNTHRRNILKKNNAGSFLDLLRKH